MASFNLPPELLAIITSLSDTETLKALRLTSRSFCTHASRSLFSTVSLYTDDKSCEGFMSIMADPDLKGHVRKICLNTVEVDYDSDDEYQDELPSRWKDLLPELSKFSNLENVALRFDKTCSMGDNIFEPHQSIEYRESILQWLATGLSSLKRPLEELAIQNQQNVTPLSPDFQRILSTLGSLRLNVVHEYEPAAPETEIEKEELEEFYARILPSVWLKPTMGSLRKLSLYSNFYWGFCPKFSLEGIHCPNLQSLTLGNFSFFEDQQLDWILSHSSTLQELYLDDCPILFRTLILDEESDLAKCPIPKSNMTLQRSDEWMKSWFYYYPRRWSDYFASFGAGLPLLRHFAIGHSEAWDSELGMPFTTNPDLIPALMRDRYMAFDGGIGPSQFLSPRLESERKDWPQCDDEDRTALKALYHKINQPVDCGEFTLGSYEVIDLVASR